MTSANTIDEASANKAALAVEANLSPRWRRLTRLEAYATGTQYAGMPHWIWPQEPAPPLKDRGPHVVDPVVQCAIGSYLDLLLGEGRWPALKCQTAEEASDGTTSKAKDKPAKKGKKRPAAPDVWDAQLAFAEDEREQVEKFLDGLQEHTRWPSGANEALDAAMSCGTVVTTIGAQRGKLTLENLRAKWCTPTWSASNPTELDMLEVRYPYTEQTQDAVTRKWVTRCWLYRRTIDRQQDITYQREEAREDGQEPSWTPETTIVHGYGFVPATWYAFARKLMPKSERDGHALHATQTDEIDALCRAESQHNRAGLYCGDPLTVETGVAKGENPSAMGQRATGVASYKGENETVAAANSRYDMGGPRAGTVRKKGAGELWSYESADVKVELKVLPPSALEVLERDRDDLRHNIDDALGWVRDREPGSQGGGIRFTGLSGEALKWMYQRQLSRCDTYRQDFADGWLLPIIRLALRIVLHHAPKPEAIYLAGAKAIAPLLERFYRKVDGQEGAQWFEPPLLVEWPAYFQPTDADKAVVAKEVRDDLAANLITPETAVTRLEPFYEDIPANNIAEYVEQLKAQKDEAAKQFGASLMAMGPEGSGDDKQVPTGPGAAKPGAAPAQRGNPGKPAQDRQGTAPGNPAKAAQGS